MADMTHPWASGAPAMEIPFEAYVSPDYARAERGALWDRVWQIACREEEIPNVGDFYTYDILDNSAIIIRSGEDEISAHFNICRHRGRRLTDGCGSARRIVCQYHGWQYHLNGKTATIPNCEDWAGALDDEVTDLSAVRVGRWGGYVFICFDPDGQSFESFLGSIPSWIDPFQMQKMRYKWRKWTRLDCNWKTAIDAFLELYHAAMVHPQNRKFGNGRCWANAEGPHTRIVTVGREGVGLATSIDSTQAKDHRQTAIASIDMIRTTIRALTTDTFVAAANTLMDVLPESATAAEVSAKLMELARDIDRERGVIWPDVADDHIRDTGFSWHVFPNSILQPAVSYGLGMRFRPDGYNPDRCLFELYALERFPDDKGPQVENEYEEELTKEKWGLLWAQDFANLPDVQRGMKCSGPQSVRPNPALEGALINFHANLARYMGVGSPRPLKK